MATVRLTSDALEQFERLPREIQGRVLKLAKRLERWPSVSGAKPLSGSLVGWFRLRTGDYRVRFHVEGHTVIVDRIGHRKDAYED